MQGINLIIHEMVLMFSQDFISEREKIVRENSASKTTRLMRSIKVTQG
jgi:hypothetical protein